MNIAFKPLLQLRSAGLTLAFGVLFTNACAVSLKDPNTESEREKIQLETWNASPGSSTYAFSKCTESGSTAELLNICGSRIGDTAALTNYNWHSNCSGSACASLSVFAHYMLTDNLGTQQTMHIEAFDNPQFNRAPVASLEISGFDASKPTSTAREEIFLAPGEYYFRAYLTHDGASAIPYSLQGMELVTDSPLGVLGALSGAQRVLVKNTSQSVEPVHIYIDQLLKKTQPAEDTQARIRLQIALPPVTPVEKFRDVHVLLLKAADLEMLPAYNFTLSSNLLTADGLATDFVSPSLEAGAYFVFAYIDSNSNGFVDSGELGAFVETEGQPTAVLVDKNRTKVLMTTLAPFRP